MAQTQFTYGETKKISVDAAKKSAIDRDAKAANFNIPAAADEVLTLSGDFYEKEWTSGKKDSKDFKEGTILMTEAIRQDGKKINIPLSFFRTRRLRDEDGIQTFPACFAADASFEEIVGGIAKDKKIKVSRKEFVFPGRSSARDIDTVVWAE